jgi:hypothetical protein
LESRGLLREPRETQEGSQEAPKELQNLKKRDPKKDPKISKFYTNLSLGPFWGPFWDPKLLQKMTKNGTTFGTLFPRISEVHRMPNQELNDSAAKATGAGIIFSKRKGGIERELDREIDRASQSFSAPAF